MNKFGRLFMEHKNMHSKFDFRMFEFANSGNWKINIRLDEKELERFSSLTVNGKEIEITRKNGMILLEGNSSPGSPLQWSLKF